MIVRSGKGRSREENHRMDALKPAADVKAALAHINEGRDPWLLPMQQESDARGQQQRQNHTPETSLVQPAEQFEARPCS